MGPLALIYLVGGPLCVIGTLCYATKTFERRPTPAFPPLLPNRRETV